MKKHLLVTSYLFAMSIIAFAQTTTITLQPGAAAGKDAEIFSCVPCGYDVRNFGNNEDLNSVAWTNNGTHSFIRSLIQFDLSAIPAGATITNARLSLYYNSDNSEGHHVTSFLFNNSTVIHRITTSWSESSVTWNTQPNVAPLHKVTLPASTSNTQNYPNINVTALVQDMLLYPNKSFGFRLKMKTEDEPRKLLFASSDHPNAALHPKLVITYSGPSPKVKTPDSPSLKNEEAISLAASLDIFPNPVKDVLDISVQVSGSSSATMKICNLIGEEIYNRSLEITNGLNKFSLQTINWTKGIYFVTIRTSKEVITKKLIVE